MSEIEITSRMTTEENLLKTYQKELKEFEDWIQENPRLPQKISKKISLIIIMNHVHFH